MEWRRNWLIANEIGKPMSMDKVTQRMCKNHWGRPGFMRFLVEMEASAEWLQELDIISRDFDNGGFQKGVLIAMLMVMTMPSVVS